MTRKLLATVIELPALFVEAFRVAPRTASIVTAWLLFLAGLFVWTTIHDGFWWAVFALAASIVIGVGLHLLNRWAAKRDGIDK